MFKPNGNENRLDYGKLLMPPEGFKLEMAIGTTYSLDLETLAAVAIPLGISENTDSEIVQNSICMLRALEKVSDKIVVFCEAGQIKMPHNPSSLELLLEKMVVEVALSKKDGKYPAFHPKTWTLSYINDAGEHRYRFIVMSRNLTFDRSWDISLAVDGVEGKKKDKNTEQISHFLEYLRDRVPSKWSEVTKKRNMIREMIRRLQNVVFSLNSKEFNDDFEILPMMGDEENGYKMSNDALFCDKKYTAASTFHDLVIMSPFLTDSVIESFNRDYRSLKDCNRTLITRRSELSKLKPEQVSNFDIYVLKDEMVDGEDYLSDENMKKMRQDIHAKIFLKRKDSHTDLYMGSMNASHAALHNNVEMMVHLKTWKYLLSGESFLNDIFCGPADGVENPFEKVSIEAVKPEQEEDIKSDLERKIKDICRLKKMAVVEAISEEKYRVSIRIEGAERDDDISISPFRSPQKKALNEEMVFENLDILKLSEFYEIKVKDGEEELHRIIMIPTTGIPQERDSAVVNSVVKDKETFVEYVSYVLGDSYLSSFIEEKQIKESGFFRQIDVMPALYEKMLRVSVEEPERLNDIKYVLDMISDEDIIPEEFRRTYKTFCDTLKLTKG